MSDSKAKVTLADVEKNIKNETLSFKVIRSGAQGTHEDRLECPPNSDMCNRITTIDGKENKVEISKREAFGLPPLDPPA